MAKAEVTAKTLWKTVWRSLKNIKNRNIIQPGSFKSGYLPKKTKILRKDIYTLILVAALIAMAEIWERPRCPSIDEWIQMIHKHT